MSQTLVNPVPQHIAIIMDGNGRWAQERHLPRLAGHNAGAKAVERTLKAAQKAGVKCLTLYAFSTENWSRPKDEIEGLFDAAKHGLRLLVSGEKEPLPSAILEKIAYAVKSTEHNTGLTLNLALNYGARQEIVHAVNALLAAGKQQISMQDISQHLYQPQLPEPELIIRTSGEERLSNFLLWQAAYSELYFSPVLWPDFNEQEFEKALSDYRTRRRRFGAL